MIRLARNSTLMIVFIISTAQAAVSVVESSPTGAPVEMARNTPVTVGWIVTTTGAGTVTSDKGTFRTAGGDVLGTVTQTLSLPAAGAGTVLFTDTVVVPMNIMVRAQLQGVDGIVYERVFSDGSGGSAGAVSLHITESTRKQQRMVTNNSAAGTSSFEASRLALSINDRPLAEIARGQKLTAKAKLQYFSNGIFDATWQLAGPDAGKDAQYRALASVNQLLADSGEVTFESPVLPTDANGAYRVRLQVTTPALRFEEPEIRYIVKNK